MDPETRKRVVAHNRNEPQKWAVMNSHIAGGRTIYSPRNDEGVDFIADIPPFFGNDKVSELIASAPDMLEALKRIRRTSVRETFYGNVDQFQQWLDNFVQDAINKAEGN